MSEETLIEEITEVPLKSSQFPSFTEQDVFDINTISQLTPAHFHHGNKLRVSIMGKAGYVVSESAAYSRTSSQDYFYLFDPSSSYYSK